MGYTLGIDLGTTTLMAAAFSEDQARAIPLGDGTITVPALTRIGGSDAAQWVSGPSAVVDGADPARIARHVKRELGVDNPKLYGDVWASPTDVMANQLQWVHGRCLELLGDLGPGPAHITLTHPAHWNEAQHQKFAEVAKTVGNDNVGFLTEPDAAANYFGTHHVIPTGRWLVVFDFGGGTTDVAVLHKAEHRFELPGRAIGNPTLGGIDVTETLLEHLVEQRGELSHLRHKDAETRLALERFFDDVKQAKEALSEEQWVNIPIPGRPGDRPVRLTREEMHDLVTPLIDEAIDLIPEALDAAGVEDRDLHGVLLAGGGSRMPLVGARIQEMLGHTPLKAGDPKQSVGMGAAIVAGAIAKRSTQSHAPLPSPAKPPAETQPSTAPVQPLPAVELPFPTVPMDIDHEAQGLQGGDDARFPRSSSVFRPPPVRDEVWSLPPLTDESDGEPVRVEPPQINPTTLLVLATIVSVALIAAVATVALLG